MSSTKIYLIILATLFSIGLSACTTLTIPNHDPRSANISDWRQGETAPREEVLMLLNRFKAMDGMSPKQLQAVHRSAERMFANQPGPLTRLQLVWLLAMNDTRFQNLPRAIKLMKAFETNRKKNTNAEVLDDLAHLIRNTLVDRKHEQDKHRKITRALDSQRKISEELATKIKNLTQIEESMTRRTQPPETKPKQ